MSAGLGREDIRALLDDLSAELAARGARAELFLVGGAALAVAYDAARATRDLDAVFGQAAKAGGDVAGRGSTSYSVTIRRRWDSNSRTSVRATRCVTAWLSMLAPRSRVGRTSGTVRSCSRARMPA
jgi:hypothetical protein